MRNIVLALAAATMLSGCLTAGPNQAGGAVVGGVAGGLLGSMVGGGTGRIAGAAIGAAAGTMVGSSVGASMDRQNQAVQQPYYAPAHVYGQNNVSGYPQTGSSAGEASAYARGRAEREAQLQQQREHDAYLRGLRGN
jgi:uncharacterized protein YcfJ